LANVLIPNEIFKLPFPEDVVLIFFFKYATVDGLVQSYIPNLFEDVEVAD